VNAGGGSGGERGDRDRHDSCRRSHDGCGNPAARHAETIAAGKPAPRFTVTCGRRTGCWSAAACWVLRTDL
jgi:hypothetical protein